MFDTIRNTIRLIGMSWKVLLKDRELILLPILAGLATLLALVLFAVAAVASGAIARLEAATGSGTQSVDVIDGAIGLAFLFVAFVIVIFFNAALVAAALERLRGGNPTVVSGLRSATRHLPQILAWSAISVVVTLVLNALRDRLGIGGRIASAIGGAAWGFATFFVLPVLVAEGIGPIAAIRRSGSLLRGTWGNQVTGSFGFGLVYVVVILVALLISGAFFAIRPLLGVLVAIPLVALGFGIVQALEGIFKAALYQFAVGETPAGFDAATLRGAYGPSSGGSYRGD